MTTNTQIRPYRIDIAQTDLDDLADRLARTRFPAGPAVDDWSRGVPPAYLKDLAEYWHTGFDWRAAEAELNSFPQFMTEIDGLDIHFMHIRSPHEDALPLLMTNGFPSSIVEFLDIIGPLTDPTDTTAPTDAFHLVIPSLPGFGLTRVPDGGWDIARTGRAWVELMRRLDYDRYGVQGVDIGGGVAGAVAVGAPDNAVAVHINGVGPMPFGPPLETDGLTGTDLVRAQRFNEFRRTGLGYLQLQATRPLTIGYALNDSPVGQLAWIIEKFAEWTDPAATLPEDAVSRDRLLANASLYWFTGAAASAANFIYESMNSGTAWGAQPTQEMGFAVFGADFGIRSLIDPDGKLNHWTEYDTGGHFAALEVPQLLAADLRTFFRRFR